jgi:NAD(P)-dependent dehydrogenase (short-subunit alcohol dehydrogenase family)
MQDFKGRVAVITGGASGIGLALARALAAEGMAVAIVDIRADMLDEALSALRGAGARAMACIADVRDAAALERVADRIEAAYGRIDLIVNNAGVVLRGPAIEDVSQTEWDWILGINLHGVLNGVRTFLPRIRKHGQGGHVLNTASIAGFRVREGRRTGAYSVSKCGTVALTEALEHDLAGTGIGISLLAPAAVNTSIYRSWELRPDAPGATVAGAVPDDILHGMPSETVARLVLDAIRRNRFYIFTHPETRDQLQARHDRIMQAYDATQAWIHDDATSQRVDAVTVRREDAA